MVFDSLLCISQWTSDITICLKYKSEKQQQQKKKIKKKKQHTLACSFFNQRMLIKGCHVRGKNCQVVASTSLILVFGPKQHKINASGSKLYMNFCMFQKETPIFTTTILSNQMHPLSENTLGVTLSFLIMGYVNKDKFQVPLRTTLWVHNIWYSSEWCLCIRVCQVIANQETIQPCCWRPAVSCIHLDPILEQFNKSYFSSIIVQI